MEWECQGMLPKPMYSTITAELTTSNTSCAKDYVFDCHSRADYVEYADFEWLWCAVGRYAR